MFLGVLYGILGCSLWGFIYIIPLLLPEYSPATVAMARFTVYSIGSLVICYYCRKTLALLTASDWVKAFCLGFFGNAVYYVLLTKGVRLAGVPTSGMLMALIPLNVALLTNRPGAETTEQRQSFPAGGRNDCRCSLAPTLFTSGDDFGRIMDRQY